MSAHRRRDPRLPGPNQEDVQTSVNGELVASYALSPVDEVIVAAHQDALDRVRYMWGLDRDDWLVAAEELTKTHPEFAKLILCRWCDAAVAAQKHDSRCPESWGFFKLAALYRSQKDYGAEIDVLEEWLSYWPEERDGQGVHREQALRMLVTAKESARQGRI